MDGKAIVADLRYEKTTKNTFRFQAVDELGKPSVMDTLYVQKWPFDKQPTSVTVTIVPHYE